MTPDVLDELLSDAESRAQSLLEREEFDDEALETLDDLAAVADEAEDLLSTVDVDELADAVDLEDVPEVVEPEDVPEAIEERDPEKAIKLRKLIKLADLSQALGSTDLTRFRREKSELQAELDDLGGSDDGSDDGLLDAGGDDGLVDGDGLTDGMDVGIDGLGEDLDGDERSELMQAAIQSKIDDAVGEFRESLLAAHERLAELREQNQARMGSQDDQPSSRSPTAYSSLPAGRGDMGGVGQHSTVPAQVRHSSAPSRERIYGDRFERRADDG